MHAEIAPASRLPVTPEYLPVSALCTCVLGEGDDSTTSTWPPQSVQELVRHHGADAPIAGLAGAVLVALLEHGLTALDAVAMHETGRRFSHVDRSSQLRACFRLESGAGGLPRRGAAAFIDAFLTLAVDAYLANAPEPAVRRPAQ